MLTELDNNKNDSTELSLSTQATRELSKITVSLWMISERIEVLESIVERSWELDEQEAFAFCSEYVQLKRDIQSVYEKLRSLQSTKWAPTIDAQEAKNICEAYLAGAGAGSGSAAKPKHCDAFLRSLAKCWEQPFFSSFKKELQAIADGYVPFLPKPGQLIRGATAEENIRNIQRATYTLLFSEPSKAHAHFYSMPKEAVKKGEKGEREIFLDYLISKGTRAAFPLLVRIYTVATEDERKDLMLNIVKAFDQAKIKAKREQVIEPVSIESITQYLTSYCKHFPTMNGAPVANSPFATPSVINLFVDCLLVPGVIQQMDTAILTEFLQKIDQDSWDLIVRPLNKIAAEKWVTENDALSIEQQALAAVIAKINSPRPSVDTVQPSDAVERCNLLCGLVSMGVEEKSKPSLWTRFLIWIGWKKPEPEFSPVQVQQLICCSSPQLAQALLDKHFRHLDAVTFLQLMQNPALCQDNKKILLNRFFRGGQESLRQAVYQQMGDKIAQVLQWVTPLGINATTLLFKDQAFRDACKQYLKMTEVMSLQKEFAAHNIKNEAVDFLNEILFKQFTDGPQIDVPLFNKLLPGAPATAMLVTALAAMASVLAAKDRSKLMLAGESNTQSVANLSKRNQSVVSSLPLWVAPPLDPKSSIESCDSIGSYDSHRSNESGYCPGGFSNVASNRYSTWHHYSDKSMPSRLAQNFSEDILTDSQPTNERLTGQVRSLSTKKNDSQLLDRRGLPKTIPVGTSGCGRFSNSFTPTITCRGDPIVNP